LETVYLLQQSHFAKAAMNISVSVIACLLAIWLGLLCGKALTGKAIIWADGMFPYGIISVNALGALLISLVASLLLPKIPMTIEHQLTLVVIIIGAYLSFSGLYVLLYLLEHGYTHTGHTRVFLMGFIGNTSVCVLVMCLGWWAVKRLDAFLPIFR
jgi:CrcB protein